MEVFKAFNSNSRNEIKGFAFLLLGFAVVREEPWRLPETYLRSKKVRVSTINSNICISYTLVRKLKAGTSQLS